MKLKINSVVETPNGKIGIVESIGCSTIWVTVRGEMKSFRPEELKAPKTVKSYDGETDVIIKAHQESLSSYPMPLRAMIDNDGTPAITGAVYRTYPCGCKVIGNGTLQFPVSIQFCNKHK